MQSNQNPQNTKVEHPPKIVRSSGQTISSNYFQASVFHNAYKLQYQCLSLSSAFLQNTFVTCFSLQEQQLSGEGHHSGQN